MGFLSTLTGGSKSSNSSASGYSTIPQEIKSGFNKLGTAVSQYTNPNDPNVIAAFTPLGETGDETAAYNAMRQGFTPTQETLGADISMLMNPYNESVINEINRQAGGDYSILKQAMNEAGQFGSNRQMLGANDIDLSRQNQIGGFLQDQYNTALGQVFNNLVPQRQADASNMLGIADRQRALDYQTNQAPITALQAGTGMIAPFTSSTSSGTISGNGGLLQAVGGLASGAGTAYKAGMFSDIRLKEDIIPVGKENGHNIYEFSYKGRPERYIGVMAQEVIETHPEAVIETPYGLMVNYSEIGVKYPEVLNG